MWDFLLQNSSFHNIIVFSIIMTIARFIFKGILKLIIIAVVIVIGLYFLNSYGILSL
ncbi:MAG: hypothetical protein L0G61_05085 [Staphylococcus equorum]|nr:hypothetical protein [Staphylococcus equorum]